MPLLNKSKPSLVQYRSPGLKTAFSRLILGWPIALLPLLAAGNGRYDSLLSNAPKLYPFFGSILLLAPPTQSSCSCAIWAHNLSLRNVCNSIPHWFATSGRGAPCCASQLQFSLLLAPEKGDSGVNIGTIFCSSLWHEAEPGEYPASRPCGPARWTAALRPKVAIHFHSARRSAQKTSESPVY